MFAENEIASVVANLKLGLQQKQGQVEAETVDVFLTGLGHLGAACQLCGVKLFDELGEVKIFESLASRLKMHGVLIVTMQFPDGDKFELVTRYNEQQQKIYSFGYKV